MPASKEQDLPTLTAESEDDEQLSAEAYKKLLELKPDDSYAKDAIDTLDKIGKTPAKSPAAAPAASTRTTPCGWPQLMRTTTGTGCFSPITRGRRTRPRWRPSSPRGRTPSNC